MNPYLLAATAMLASTAPLVVLAARARVPVGLVALELSSTIVTLVLMLIAEGTHRQPFFDLALVSALLSFAGSLAFARFLERWISVPGDAVCQRGGDRARPGPSALPRPHGRAPRLRRAVHRRRGVRGGGLRPAAPRPDPHRGHDRPGSAGRLPRSARRVGSVALAAIALRRRWLPLPASAVRALEGSLLRLRRLHSGQVGDYVAWLTAGVAALGGALALALG